MKRFGWATVVLLGLIALLAAGCVRTDEGVAIRNEDIATSSSCVRRRRRDRREDAGPARPGILATTRAPIPADTVTCAEPARVRRMAVRW